MYQGLGLAEGAWAAIAAGIQAGTQFVTARYGVPQTRPGQYVQTGPGGTTYGELYPYQAGINVGGGMGNLVLIGALVIGGIILVSAVRR